MINTQEYTQMLEQLQHGLISTQDWMEYCSSIRTSIVVETHPRNPSTMGEKQEEQEIES